MVLGEGEGAGVLVFISDLLVESAKSDFRTESIFLTCKSSQILDLFNQTLTQNATPQFGGGDKLQNIK